MEILSGREKYQRKVLSECTIIPLGTSCPGSYQLRLFRDSKLVVWVVVIYGCCDLVYLLGEDRVDV